MRKYGTEDQVDQQEGGEELPEGITLSASLSGDGRPTAPVGGWDDEELQEWSSADPEGA